MSDRENPPPALAECLQCSAPIEPNGHGGMTKKYCSATCRRAADSKRNGLERSRRRGPRPEYRRDRYRNDPEWRRHLLARNLRRHYMKKAASSSGERFGLDDIFERDAGRCHLCRKKVTRDQASMDHIVPLSLGGEHSLANVALAHRSCNSAKNNRPANEQLRLVG